MVFYNLAIYNQLNIIKMKTKMMIVAVSIGMLAMSCGDAAETTENNAVEVEANQDLENKLDEINVEIEAIEAADAEIDETMNELDQI